MEGVVGAGGCADVLLGHELDRVGVCAGSCRAVGEAARESRVDARGATAARFDVAMGAGGAGVGVAIGF